MAARKHPTSVNAVKTGVLEAMNMRILRRDFGWEILFNYSSDTNGSVKVFDAADSVIDSSEVEPGDDVAILLNVADWGLTEDNIKDAIEAVK